MPDNTALPERDPAPIVLFTFHRPDHTARTLDALARNTLADRSDLVIFQDGPRAGTDMEAYAETTRLAKAAQGFRSVRFIQRENNIGLADSLYSGVSQMLAEHDRVIVLEDDNVTAPNFLTFMNQALDHYREEPRVWHISGWNYPIEADGLGDAFLWRVMNCWGWATWADRWQHFEFDREAIAARFDDASRKRFNLGGSYNFYRQIRENLDGTRLTWAVFWYATIFHRDGLCLNAARSLVENIGHDGSGENCGTDFLQSALAGEQHDFAFPQLIAENAEAVERVRRNLAGRGWRGKVRRILEQITA